MKKILFAIGTFVALLASSPAMADVKFCNDYSSPMYVAWGQLAGNDILDCDERFSFGSMADMELIGWFYVTPGNCTTVFQGCYGCDPGSRSGCSIAYYATATDGAYWAGPDYGEKLSYNAFDFCAGTTACYGGSCPPFNYGPVGFAVYTPPTSCNLEVNFSP